MARKINNGSLRASLVISVSTATCIPKCKTMHGFKDFSVSGDESVQLQVFASTSFFSAVDSGRMTRLSY